MGLRLVDSKIQAYPIKAQNQIKAFRDLVYKVAKKLEIDSVEESLKWNELSYSVKGGSPIRIDWKESNPEVIQIFVNCQTSLISIYKEIIGKYDYSGNRGVSFSLKNALPKRDVSRMIEIAFEYKTKNYKDYFKK